MDWYQGIGQQFVQVIEMKILENMCKCLELVSVMGTFSNKGRWRPVRQK